jgi:hypothetical protein
MVMKITDQMEIKSSKDQKKQKGESTLLLDGSNQLQSENIFSKSSSTV